ncbi:calphotin-like [Ischnura elegans]|uniref:calphotin-like n=1 Tax=Ischnura elegans TaxID=197161 RepID=UPI001ED89606|nr:calphotin-like [Ischnura elegans]
MRSLLILVALVGVTFARPGYYGLGLGARGLYHSPLAYSSVYSPVPYSTVAAAPAPITYAAPVEVSSQYHAQDELGQYSYGYAGGPSAKSEVKTWDGVTRGGYSYVDAEGKIQTVNYVADPVNGFRVAATNLPVAPSVPAVPAVPEVPASAPLVAPTPVEDTPEVAAAKEAHLAAFAEAKAAAEAAPDDPEPAETPAAEEPAKTPTLDVAPASTEVLPASVLSREVAAIPYPGLSYAAYAPAAYHYSTPAQYAYHSVFPYNRYAYSTYAPQWHPFPALQAPYTAAPVTYSAPIAYTAPVAAPAPVSYAPAPVSYAPAPVSYAAPVEVSSQYHAQDELGQYSYGYAGGPSAKSEVRTWDGITRGGYSYIDAEGKVQTVNYVADPVNGFRVAATNLPVGPEAPVVPALQTVPDTAEVAAAKAEHLAAVEEAKSRLTAA